MLIIKEFIEVSLIQVVVWSLGVISVRLESALLKLVISSFLLGPLDVFLFNLVENLFSFQLVLHVASLCEVRALDCVFDVLVSEHGSPAGLMLRLDESVHGTTEILHFLRILGCGRSLAGDSFELRPVATDLLHSFLTCFLGH